MKLFLLETLFCEYVCVSLVIGSITELYNSAICIIYYYLLLSSVALMYYSAAVLTLYIPGMLPVLIILPSESR